MIAPRPLTVLTACVLAMHALLLAAASAPERAASTPPPPRAFATRTLAAPAAPPAAAAAVPPARTAKPAPRRAAAPRPPAPPPPVEATDSTPIDAALAAPAPEYVAPDEAELLALAAAPAEAPEAPASEAAPPTAPPTAPPASEAGTEPAQAPEAANSPPPPGPVRLPPSTRMDFEVTGKAKGFGYNALAQLIWQHDGESYSAHQELKVMLLGSRSQDSVGSITPHGLQPRRFGDRARSERAAHFDFAAGRVTFSANNPPATIAPGAQDRLSVFLQLAGLLAGAPERYPPGTQIAMTTVSARGADVWTFTVQEEQTLDLPVGPTRAIALERLPRRDHDQKAQVWLAPELGYLPVRIRITEANGDFAELSLRAHAPP